MSLSKIQTLSNLYAVDGFCHNANRGTYGHECNKHATWIGTNERGFSSGYCSHCKEHGDEARDCVSWSPIGQLITPTEHDKAEWSRLAQAAYHSGWNEVGHTFSAGASLPRNGRMDIRRYDAMMAVYRDWLCFGRLAVPATVYAEG